MAAERNHEQQRASRDALVLYTRGSAFLGEGLYVEAEQAFRRGLELSPDDKDAWFNLSLVYKRLHRWADCLRCTRRVVELDPSEEGAWWNMGIAATAIRDWPAARAGWRGHGIELPDGDGPIESSYGLTPIRLNPDAAGEVVWCERIDPARAIIRNIPLPESGYRWGDYVLHDGEPRGERVVDGHGYPVFDALERWQPSETPTLRVEVSAPSESDAEALCDLFDEQGLCAEDWTASLRQLCASCSTNAVHQHDRHGERPAEWQVERDFGLAAPLEAAEQLLARWASQGAGRRVGRPELAA